MEHQTEDLYLQKKYNGDLIVRFHLALEMIRHFAEVNSMDHGHCPFSYPILHVEHNHN